MWSAAKLGESLRPLTARGYRVSSEGAMLAVSEALASLFFFFMSLSCPQCLRREFDMTLKWETQYRYLCCGEKVLVLCWRSIKSNLFS